MTNKFILSTTIALGLLGVPCIGYTANIQDAKPMTITTKPAAQAKVTAVKFLPLIDARQEIMTEDNKSNIKVPAQAKTVVKKENDANAVKSGKSDLVTTKPPIELLKRVALDKDCDGIADTNYSKTAVAPGNGQCLVWSLTVKNNSADTYCDIHVKDQAPRDVSTISIEAFILDQPEPGEGQCDMDGQRFSCKVGNAIDMDNDGTKETACLRSSETAEIRYGIKLNDVPAVN